MPQDKDKERRAQSLLDAAGMGTAPIVTDVDDARAQKLLDAAGMGAVAPARQLQAQDIEAPAIGQPTQQPVAPVEEPTFGQEAAGVGRDLNIGIATSLGLPVDLVTNVLNAANFLSRVPFQTPESIEPAFPQQQRFGSAGLTETLRGMQGPQTETGQLIGRGAEFMGGSMAPLGVASQFGRVGQAITKAPIKALGVEAAVSGLAAGGGELAAGLAGEGARPVGELAGALSPTMAAGAVARAAGRETRRLADPDILAQSKLDEQGAFRAEQALGAGDILLPAQRIGDPFLLESQSFLAQLPEGSRIAAKALEKQNKKSFDLVQRVINEVAAPSTVGTAGAKFKTASAKAIELKRIARDAKADPIFTDAKNIAKADKTRVDVSEVQDEFDSLKGQFVKETAIGSIVRKMETSINSSASRGIVGGKGKVSHIGDTNLIALHGAKTNLDREIATAIEKGDRQLLRPLMRIKERLTDAMGNASPDYAKAERIFAENSPQVDEIIQSVIGRAAAKEGDKIPLIARDIFASGTQNPSTIKKSKAIIEGVDPVAWKNIVRAEIENRLGAITEQIAETGPLAVENIPGQLRRTLFGTAKARSNLMAGMDKHSRESFVLLDKVLKRASLGRPGGSQTGVRGEIASRLQSIATKLRQGFRPLELASGGFRQGVDESITRGQARLFFDPSGFNASMSKLRGRATNPKAVLRALSSLDDNIVEQLPPQVPED